MDHIIKIEWSFRAAELLIECRCGFSEYVGASATLDELNRLAHEHIEAADRAPLIR